MKTSTTTIEEPAPAPITRRRPPLLAAFAWLLAAFVGLCLLGTIVGQVLVDRSPRAEAAALRWVSSIRSQPLTDVARLLSLTGSTAVLVPLAVLTAAWLLKRRRTAEAALLSLATVGAIAIGNAIKLLVARPRPDVAHLTSVSSFSFPSGHACQAAAVYVAIALLVRSGRGPRRLSAIVAAVSLALVVGLSRLYLGVHYPTDVIAGLALGWAWVAAVALAVMTYTRPSSRSAVSGTGRSQHWWGAVGLLLAAGLGLGLLIVWEGDVGDVLGLLPGAVTSLLQQFGRVAAYVLLYVEESGIPLPVPGDVYVMYIGHRAAGGTAVWLLSWLGLIGVVVLGASNLYLISRRMGPRLTSGRVGRLLHLDEERLMRGKRWFDRWGIWAIIFGRHLPGLRIPITVAAGALGVPYARFAAGVAVSTAIWAGVFMFIGGSLSDEIEAAVKLHRGSLIVTSAVLALAMAATLGVRFARRFRAPDLSDSNTAGTPLQSRTSSESDDSKGAGRG